MTVAGGVITGVGPLDRSVRGSEAAQVVELGDDVVLLPGLVDTHVHVNEPGRTEWEGFATATRAAAAGGVTTIVDMPLNSLPPTLDPASLAVKRAAAAGQCAVDVGFWGGAVPGNLGRLTAAARRRRDGLQVLPARLGRRGVPGAVDRAARAGRGRAGRGRRAAARARRGPGRAGGRARAGGRSYARFLASRPAQAEDTAIETALAAARRTGVRLHVVHLSSATALPALAAARADGVRVTVETCPHYLVLEAEQVPDGATAVEVLPADPRRGQPGGALGRARRRDHRPGGQRPLAVDARPQGAGHRRLRRGLGRHLVGAARPAAGLDRGPPARPRPGRRRALDVGGARGPGRPRHQGRHPGRCGRRPGGIRPGCRPRGRPGPAAPPQPGVARTPVRG